MKTKAIVADSKADPEIDSLELAKVLAEATEANGSMAVYIPIEVEVIDIEGVDSTITKVHMAAITSARVYIGQDGLPIVVLESKGLGPSIKMLKEDGGQDD